VRLLPLLAALVACLTVGVGSGLGSTGRSAVGISSVSPLAAHRGDTVTVAGIGFGGPEVRVTVGGVAAQVLSATGTSARFVVPGSAPLGLTTVRATNPGGQFGEIGFTVLFDGKVTPALDQPDAVQGQIGAEGGTITTGGGISLSIPPGAVGETQTITLVPLSGLGGSPLDLLGGVELEPQGLHFLVPATLTVPLPADVDPRRLVGFGFDGDGINFHLKPGAITGGTISVQISHFSGGGAGTLSPAQSAAILGYQPSGAQYVAEQQIALALNAFQQGTIDASTRDARIDSALTTWYQTSVKVGLQVVGNSIEFYELAVGEWQAWRADVAAWSEASRHAAQDDEATGLATADAAHLADLGLSACTGQGDLVAPLQPLTRLSSDLGTVPLAIETKTTADGRQLPTADNGALLKACLHVEFTSLEKPAAFAVLGPNTITASVRVKFWNGQRTDLPIELDLWEFRDGLARLATATTTTSNGNSTISFRPGGDFGTRIYLLVASLPGQGLPGEDTTPAGSASLFDAENGFNAEIRARIELRPAAATVSPGGSVRLNALLAGDGMADATIGYSNNGSGTLSANSGTTDANGTTTLFYTAANDPAGGSDTITATFNDATTTDQAQTTITITGTCSNPAAAPLRFAPIIPLSQPNDQCTPVSVSVTPATTSVAPGQQTTFAATVTGANDPTVTWTATGGTIDQTGKYTAGTTPGTYTVTATSKADPSASATGTVTIGAPTNVIRLPGGNGSVYAAGIAGPFVAGCGEGGSASFASPTDATSWSDGVSCTATALTANGNVMTGAADANVSFDEPSLDGTLLGFDASGSADASSGGDDSGSGSGAGNAGFTIAFKVTATTQMTIQVGVEADGDNSAARVLMIGSGVAVFDADPSPLCKTATGGPCPTSIGTTFTLDPGSYVLSASVGDEEGGFIGGGSASFTVTASFG
jgi:hypothetical protein